MFGYLFQGAAIGFSAGIAPGPLLALFSVSAMQNGWRKTLPAALAPIVSDGPIILLMLVVLAQVPAAFMDAIRIGGGIYLLRLSWALFQREQRSGQAPPARDNPQTTFRSAVLINLLNPNPYIFWGTVLGPAIVEGWRASPSYGIAFAAGFYSVMIAINMLWIIAFGSAGRLNAGVRRTLTFLSGLGMAGFGLWQIGAGFGWT